MNRKLVVSILAIILVITMVLSLVMMVIPTNALGEGISSGTAEAAANIEYCLQNVI